MTAWVRLASSNRGAAAAEMALVTPMLVALMMGSVELGNFFYSEHILVKAVRDGARFAARQDFANYDCTGAPGGTVVDDTRTLVKTSLLSGGTDRLPTWNAATISVTESCIIAAGGETLAGIYRGRATGAPVVRVSAAVPYVPVIGMFGFNTANYHLQASQEAAVMGL